MSTVSAAWNLCPQWPWSVCVSFGRSPARWRGGGLGFSLLPPLSRAWRLRHLLWLGSCWSRSKWPGVLGARRSGTRSCDCARRLLRRPGRDAFATRARWRRFRGDGPGEQGARSSARPRSLLGVWRMPSPSRNSRFLFAARVLSHVPKPPQHRGCGGGGRRRQEAGRLPPDLVVRLRNSSDLQQQTGISPLCLPGQAVPACVSPSSGFAGIFPR